MRIRDNKKKEALFLATIKLVNEMGFVASSVSKIAKEAGVSPATLYIHFDNKEDLIVSTYLQIKREMSRALFEGLDETRPVREVLRQIWRNAFCYASSNNAEYLFSEQFSNSSYVQNIKKEMIMEYFAPLIQAIKRGIAEGIIKDVHFHILITFFYYPVMILSNPKLCHGLEIQEEFIETAFTLAWDAIKV